MMWRARHHLGWRTGVWFRSWSDSVTLIYAAPLKHLQCLLKGIWDSGCHNVHPAFLSQERYAVLSHTSHIFSPLWMGCISTLIGSKIAADSDLIPCPQCLRTKQLLGWRIYAEKNGTLMTFIDVPSALKYFRGMQVCTGTSKNCIYLTYHHNWAKHLPVTFIPLCPVKLLQLDIKPNIYHLIFSYH